mmetsp:Transcript_21852/g.62793  ORF Transcript_21852/g.62793 Transcript_21852/m.62793 type:complete len:209 (+) Transcript_21852:1595-2221(+)
MASCATEVSPSAPACRFKPAKSTSTAPTSPQAAWLSTWPAMRTPSAARAFACNEATGACLLSTILRMDCAMPKLCARSWFSSQSLTRLTKASHVCSKTSSLFANAFKIMSAVPRDPASPARLRATSHPANKWFNATRALKTTRLLVLCFFSNVTSVSIKPTSHASFWFSGLPANKHANASKACSSTNSHSIYLSTVLAKVSMPFARRA